eukprot:CAMPEP_0177677828 /NCGR_PEP_ID=MMETSP0447-20121125/28638_1 /TAXON_ID=0 /ORGANISM="Stygamoeba regulata, Strain BSH-02190019" /LENGTH=78 /DNA_ID=CAMNT_0019186699 /DNA_START=158 /DNA_END=391 /DNA_ORIENTATION=-
MVLLLIICGWWLLLTIKNHAKPKNTNLFANNNPPQKPAARSDVSMEFDNLARTREGYQVPLMPDVASVDSPIGAGMAG